MDETGYPFKLFRERSFYRFESVSSNKIIKKAVVISRVMGSSILHNLALLDSVDDDEFSDQTESRNGDLRKVLATIFHIVEHFLSMHPKAVLGIKGNDHRRHRLYRIVITRELSNLSGRYEIYGSLKDGTIVPFEPDVEYEHYFIKNI